MPSRARFTYDSYSTHQPVLYEAVMRTSGPVVEFGCGHGSTPLLHKICDGRRLLTLEDAEWLEKFILLTTSWHGFGLAVDWAGTTDYVALQLWDVALIDHAPWEARVAAVLALKDKIKFIVLHDCDYFVTHGLLDFDELFKYHKEFLPLKPWPYPPTGPPTLLASNFEDCDWDIDYEKYREMECFA